jgi:hypothetical protein
MVGPEEGKVLSGSNVCSLRCLGHAGGDVCLLDHELINSGGLAIHTSFT